MDNSNTRLRLFLLDILSSVRPIRQADLDGLSDADWTTLLGMVRQHRLGPLWFWQFKTIRSDLKLPDSIQQELAAVFRKSAMRALLVQRELMAIHEVLSSQGIPYRVLKGPLLDVFAYPKPGLRPMRDVDVLVCKEKLLGAYAALIDRGFRQKEEKVLLQSVSSGQHLPALLSRDGQLIIEVHGAMFHLKGTDQDLADPSCSAEFWRRGVVKEVGGVPISFTSPTDTLLHLIVHAVCDHQFHNGPLLLSDLAYLIDTEAIDWPLFWELAASGGYSRACLLALRLMERYWGERPIPWPAALASDAEVADDYLDAAALLMLERTQEAQVYVNNGAKLSNIGSFSGKMAYVLGKVFPAKEDMARIYPVNSRSPKLYALYAIKGWRALWKHTPNYVKSRFDRRIQQERQQLTALQGWLDG